MMTVACMRGLRITVEQPLNSMLYRIPSMASSIQICRLHRVVTWMGAWGADTMKPDEIFTDLRPHQICSIQRTRTEARARVGMQSRLVKETTKSATKQLSAKYNKKWVTGDKKMMKESARYPVKFSSSLAECTISELSPKAATATRCALPARKRIVRRTTV